VVPGIVETCLVMIDTREVALHRYPVSALIDIADMLTRQYPFRLHRMFVISESFFVQVKFFLIQHSIIYYLILIILVDSLECCETFFN
jgi:hypothetical protein